MVHSKEPIRAMHRPDCREAQRRVEGLRDTRARLARRLHRAKMVSAILPVFAATMAAGFFDPALYSAAIRLMLASALVAALGYWLVDRHYLAGQRRRVEAAYQAALADLHAVASAEHPGG
jgi:hypothetical protein